MDNLTAHSSNEGKNPSLLSTFVPYFTVQGNIIRVTRPTQTKPRIVPTRQSGDVKFSHKSRMRLMRLLATLDQTKLPVFATLTYSEVPETARFKRDLDAFGKQFRRRFEHGAFIWRLELQERGAAHYHLLAFGVKCQEFKPWAIGAWCAMANADERALKIVAIRSWRGATAYTSKALARVDADQPAYAGRWWGIVGKENLPFAPIDRVAITNEQAGEIMQAMIKHARIDKRDYPSLTVFANDEEFTNDVLELAGVKKPEKQAISEDFIDDDTETETN